MASARSPALYPFSGVTVDRLRRRHCHALSDETLRRALAYLRVPDLRKAGQVCARWRRLAITLIDQRGSESCARLMRWDVLHRVFGMLDPPSLKSVTRVCVLWKSTALCFFSGRIGRRHVHDLPAEVVKHSFALLPFDDLWAASQVCVRWRDLGIEHPGFWQEIEVRSPRSGSMELLAAQLGQSNGRPCSVTVDIECMHANIESKLLYLINAIMPSVQTLRIRLNAFYQIMLWRLLNAPAPELVSFHLTLCSPDRVLPLIPLNPWIFDNSPGKLSEVIVEDVFLPYNAGGIPAFTGLRRFSVLHPPGVRGEFPSHIIQHCPNLEYLKVFSGTLELVGTFSPAALDVLAHVEILDVHLAPHALVDFVSQMPHCDKIPTMILTTPPDVDAVYDFLAPLRHPFKFGIMSAGSQFCIILEDSRSGYRRVLAEDVSTYARALSPSENETANPLFDNPLFPEQLLFLKISVSLWQLLVPYLSHFTLVPKLVVEFDDPSTVALLPRQRLSFLSLHTLVLEARKGLSFVRAQDIIDFVDHTVCARECRNLVLHNVWVEDSDFDLLSDRFDSVMYKPYECDRKFSCKGRK